MTVRESALWLRLALSVLLLGCAVTDTGNPPIVDPTLVTGMSLFGGTVSLSGEPGAIDPPTGVVRVTNLDNVSDPTDTPVAADGSFSLSLAAEVGDELRIMVVDGGLRSDPLDVDASSFEPIARPFADCLVFDPDRVLDLGTTDGAAAGTVTLNNDCAETLTLAPPAARREGPLTVAGTLSDPPSLEPGARAELSVEATPDGAGEFEAVLFLSVAGSSAARFPITVHLVAR